MKTAILTRNPRDKGKSHSITAIYEELVVGRGAKVLHSKIDKPEVATELEYPDPKTKKTKRIGIESKGDPEAMADIVRSLNDFVAHGCEVILCASRMGHPTRDTVINLCRNAGYVVVETSNYHFDGATTPILPNGVNVNQQYARAIADLVDQVL